MGEFGIYLLIGLPRSGKSTWAKNMARKHGWPIVNPDSVRYALHGMRYVAIAEPFVWAIVYCMVKALHLAGHDWVIIDATNTTRKRREPWWDGFGLVNYVVFKASKELCIERAKKIHDDSIIPIIEKMDAQFEPVGVEHDTIEFSRTCSITEV